MSSQGVTAVKRLSARRDGTLKPTNTWVLTFARPTVPPNVVIEYEFVKVEQYLPNPLRCFKCQGYGHHKQSCKRNEICANCGKPAHLQSEEECTDRPSCANCKGSHAAYSRECPHWLREKEIVKIKHTFNIPFPEARKRYDQVNTHFQLSASYAAKAAKQTTTVEVQTDLTWPINADTFAQLPTTAPVREVAPRKRSAAAATATQTAAAMPTAQQTATTSIPSSPASQPSAAAAAQAAAGASTGARPKIKPITAPSTQIPRPTGNNGNKGNKSGRMPKGASDPISLYNRFGTIGESMDTQETSTSPKQGSNRNGGKTPHR